jgi:hypothetical protein
MADEDNYVFVKYRVVAYYPASPFQEFPYWTWGVQLWERIRGIETAISSESQFDTAEGSVTDGPDFTGGRLCIIQGEQPSYYGDSGDPDGDFPDCGTNNELIFTMSDSPLVNQGFTLRGLISDITALGNLHAIYASAPLGVAPTFSDVTVEVHEADCAQCDCLACLIGSSPEQLRAKFSDIDTPDPEPEFWSNVYSYLTEWKTFGRGFYYDTHNDYDRVFSPCVYGYKDTSLGSIILGSPAAHYSMVIGLLRPTPGETCQIRFRGLYGTAEYDEGSVLISSAQIDCCDVLDGIEVSMTLYDADRTWFVDQAEITGSTGDSITIAEDWSFLSAGRELLLFSGGSSETYTVSSTTGSGPTTITVAEAIPADRTGWTVKKWATLTVEVVQ